MTFFITFTNVFLNFYHVFLRFLTFFHFYLKVFLPYVLFTVSCLNYRKSQTVVNILTRFCRRVRQLGFKYSCVFRPIPDTSSDRFIANLPLPVIPSSCWKQAGVMRLLFISLFIFNDFGQSNFLKIYWIDHRQIFRVVVEL